MLNAWTNDYLTLVIFTYFLRVLVTYTQKVTKESVLLVMSVAVRLVQNLLFWGI